MPGSPYRTPPHAAPRPSAYNPDDRALPMVPLAIMLAALLPPLGFGAVSIWDALRPTADAGESRAHQRRGAQGAKQVESVPSRRGDL